MKDRIYLCAVVALALLNHLWWTAHWHSAPRGDIAVHLAAEARVYALWHGPLPWWAKVARVWLLPSPYPNLVYAVSSLLNGVGAHGCVRSLMIFTVLAVVGAYAIARRVGPPELAAAAACLVAADPVMLSGGRNYLLDMPLAAMVLVTLVALLRGGDFDRSASSAGLGLLLGLGFLTKYTFIWFLGLPFLAVAGRALRQPDRRVSRLVNLSICVGTTFLLCLPWMAANRAFLGHNVNALRVHLSVTTRGVAILAWLVRYIPLPVLVLGCIGAHRVARQPQLRVLQPVLLSFGSGLVFTALILEPDQRLYAPVNALLAVLAVTWTASASPRLRRQVLVGVMMLSSINLLGSWAEWCCGIEPDHAPLPLRLLGNLSRQRLADGRNQGEDLEPAAWQIMAHVNDAARSLWVVQETEDYQRPLVYMLMAVAGWSGRPVEVGLAGRFEGPRKWPVVRRLPDRFTPQGFTFLEVPDALVVRPNEVAEFTRDGWYIPTYGFFDFVILGLDKRKRL